MVEKTSKNDSDLYADYFLLNDIKKVSATKKSLGFLEENKYTFLVSPILTKSLIKMSIENYFNVRVCKINTLNLAKKKKRVGRYIGFKSKLKKTVITLQDSEKIPLFTDV